MFDEDIIVTFYVAVENSGFLHINIFSGPVKVQPVLWFWNVWNINTKFIFFDHEAFQINFNR